MPELFLTLPKPQISKINDIFYSTVVFMGWGWVPNWLNSWYGMPGVDHVVHIDGHQLRASVIQTPDGQFLKVSTLDLQGSVIDCAHLALHPNVADDGGWELAEAAAPAEVPLASPAASSGGGSGKVATRPRAPTKATATATASDAESVPGPDEAVLADLIASGRWPTEHLEAALDAGIVDALAAVDILYGRRGWCADSIIYVPGKPARSVSAYAVLRAPAQGVEEPCWTRKSKTFRKWVAPAGVTDPILTGRVQFDRDAVGRAVGSVGELHAYFAGAGCATPPASA